MKKVLLLSLLALLPVLQGCVTAVATGVGAGVLMAEDRRTSGTYIEDEGIELKAFHRLDEKLGNRVHINATSFNRHVLLTGEVPDQAAREEAEKIVRGIPNVKRITNELLIAGISSLAERSNDTYLTSKVKIRFIDAAKFSPVHVKVITEGGSVFLMGTVKRHEGDAAVEIARTTGGVRKVVKVFEYID